MSHLIQHANITYHTPLSHIFFFNHTSTTEIYTLSLHDALPISQPPEGIYLPFNFLRPMKVQTVGNTDGWKSPPLHLRSEEHTSELQSQSNLVCRLLLEKKKIN